ncbi:hypothetical protein [Acinetobacter sp.]|uniref:hypothetical protein n=1 Tax=Acinetobacter sp. TaxID=472 RepID=UPI003D013F6F
MKKSENLVATLLAIYGILCAISIALYALIQIFVEDKSTATNLLIWSATMFAPIVLIISLKQWSLQKRLEDCALLAQKIRKIMELKSADIWFITWFLKEYKYKENESNALIFDKCKELQNIFLQYHYDLNVIEASYHGEDSAILEKYLSQLWEIEAGILLDIDEVKRAEEIETLKYLLGDPSRFMLLHKQVIDLLLKISLYRFE